MKIKKIFLVIGILLLSGIMLLTGIEIGRHHANSIPESPDVIKFFASALKSIPGIPFEIELNQEKLNEIIIKSEESLKPLTGAKLTISKNKTLILTGNVEKNEISQLFEEEIPSYINVFLPQTISLFVEIQFSDEETDELSLRINNVTIAGITFSGEYAETLGINKMATNLLTETLGSKASPYYTVNGIMIRDSKSDGEPVLLIKGKAKIS